MNNTPLPSKHVMLVDRLKELSLAYEIVNRDPTLTRQIGIDLCEGVATLIMEGDGKPFVVIRRDDRKLSFKKIKKLMGVKDLKFSSKEMVKELTGCDVGYVSLYNNLPGIIDQSILEKAYVYGGTGSLEHDLKIPPRDLVKLTSTQIADITE